MASWISNVFLLSIYLYLILIDKVSSSSTLKHYCWPDSFNASCAYDKVIILETVRYGRMDYGTCLTSDIHIGCHANVLTQTDLRCSGQSSCKLEIPDSQLHEISACPKDQLAYVEASYQCVKVESCSHNIKKIEAKQYGYIGRPISNLLLECKWVITVSPGQQLNITLLDFSVANKNDNSGICIVYAIIREPMNDAHINVCHGRQRIRNVYISQANEIEIQTFADPTAAGNFLLRYEVVGCAEPHVPKDATVRRQEDKVTVSCNHSAETWYLYCSGSTWIGPQRNCSASHNGILNDKLDSSNSDSFPYSLITAVIVGIIMGIIFGILLLIAVLSCEQRRRKYRRKNEVENVSVKACITDYWVDPTNAHSSEEDSKVTLAQYGYTRPADLKGMCLIDTGDNMIKSMKNNEQYQEQYILCDHSHSCRLSMGNSTAAHLIHNPDKSSYPLYLYPQDTESSDTRTSSMDNLDLVQNVKSPNNIT